MNEDTRQLYTLEKTWKYKPGIKLDMSNVYEILIRPCNVSYKTYRRFALGLPTRCKTIMHEGCVLSWWPKDSSQLKFETHLACKTFEEFMLHANINMNINPLFENWIIAEEYNRRYVKTIDLKTNEVLYDNVDKALKQFNEHYRRHLI